MLPAFVEHHKISEWSLKASDEEISWTKQAFILRKYEKWARKFNYQILRILEGDLLIASDPRIEAFNHRINPHRDDINMGYKVLNQAHLEFSFICLLSAFLATLMVALVEHNFRLPNFCKCSKRIR